MKKTPEYKPFHSAESEFKMSRLEQAQAYNLAFADQEFLLREELRPVRLQLELVKPELIQQDHDIEKSVVIFGSARIPEPETAKARLEKAKKELTEAPEDTQKQKQVNIAKNVVELSHYYDVARQLGQHIAAEKGAHGEPVFFVKTGGGPGFMEAANRGAHDVEAKSIGMNIVVPHEQHPNPYVTPELTFHFHYFAIRKMHFLIRARALVAFPGGFGTLDELFEALTLIQTKKMTPIPIFLFCERYWRSVINFDSLIEHGVIAEKDLELFTFVETAEECWQGICNYYKDDL